MKKHVWGVLGGMGPLASAEFLSTIYQRNTTVAEQECPIVILLSDPSFPDRTEAMLNGHTQMLFEQFSARMDQLVSLGVTRIVVCCVTIHPLISRLSSAVRSKVISLLDIIFDRVLQSPRRHLLLCTQGARTMGLFQQHPAWFRAREHMILPSDHDQQVIHEWIYEMKSNCHLAGRREWFRALLQKYSVDSFIAGCTELHIVAREQQHLTGCDSGESCIDPLMEIAAMMWDDMRSSSAYHSIGIQCQLQP